jgi:hypothetical protein
MPGPHDFTVRNSSVVAQKRPTSHGHRIPASRIVTIARTSLCSRRDGADETTDLGVESRIFWKPETRPRAPPSELCPTANGRSAQPPPKADTRPSRSLARERLPFRAHADMAHAQVVIITRTGEQNEQNCRVAAANQMNHRWSEQHNYNIRCSDHPVRVVEDTLVIMPESGTSGR